MNNTEKRTYFASNFLSRRNIRHMIKSAELGYMICFDSIGRRYEFYAGTGKIQGYRHIRGIFALADLIDTAEEVRA